MLPKPDGALVLDLAGSAPVAGLPMHLFAHGPGGLLVWQTGQVSQALLNQAAAFSASCYDRVGDR